MSPRNKFLHEKINKIIENIDISKEAITCVQSFVHFCLKAKQSKNKNSLLFTYLYDVESKNSQKKKARLQKFASEVLSKKTKSLWNRNEDQKQPEREKNNHRTPIKPFELDYEKFNKTHSVFNVPFSNHINLNFTTINKEHSGLNLERKRSCSSSNNLVRKSFQENSNTCDLFIDCSKKSFNLDESKSTEICNSFRKTFENSKNKLLPLKYRSNQVFPVRNGRKFAKTFHYGRLEQDERVNFFIRNA